MMTHKWDEPWEPALEWKFDFALPFLGLVLLIERDNFRIWDRKLNSLAHSLSLFCRNDAFSEL